ncbi:hypothetical protein COW86_00950 [Candidatus Kuenenbacteria bacterium CG22_combo_CG10-13_8_21_14_all_39_9]|uniref:Uncharacterized protein n=1 Tax=Candidatus Kuenenbacteria bacterium CG22_combo_CG10-13_8_21_14_all_39_9 TaxID=1974621 RepID=A0A2H0D1A6_9BACT|nr:MAG: hypothetical protein COW86_00950 [Candidatus Kuenenbacteria bacterium CG22_combo_CG10-13_8_21_14_all_39_9]
MPTLWNQNQEKNFFTKSLEFATPEQLFYITKDKKFLAYWPKNYDGAKTTLQSRNSLIGSYTEKWATDLFSEIAKAVGGYSVQGVISEEIELTNQSPTDVAICKTKDIIQKPQNILMIIEVKMSVVWNWEFAPATKNLVSIGDYRTHQGNPGLLRSDTMLKAIGKSINIRVSSFSASNIPIIIIGNTPVTKSYYEKVDHLKRNGIIQGFWSINPKPLDNNGENIKSTQYKGFYRFDEYEELKQNAIDLLKEEREFFSSMQTQRKLGEIIEIANKEATYEAKAQKFLTLLRQSKE